MECIFSHLFIVFLGRLLLSIRKNIRRRHQ